MHKIYENFYGPDNEKIAKVYLELGQIYEQWNKINDAIENFLFPVISYISSSVNSCITDEIFSLQEITYIQIKGKETNVKAVTLNIKKYLYIIYKITFLSYFFLLFLSFHFFWL